MQSGLSCLPWPPSLLAIEPGSDSSLSVLRHRKRARPKTRPGIPKVRRRPQILTRTQMREEPRGNGKKVTGFSYEFLGHTLVASLPCARSLSSYSLFVCVSVPARSRIRVRNPNGSSNVCPSTLCPYWIEISRCLNKMKRCATLLSVRIAWEIWSVQMIHQTCARVVFPFAVFEIPVQQRRQYFVEEPKSRECFPDGSRMSRTLSISVPPDRWK
jgi:hypothetical protein